MKLEGQTPESQEEYSAAKWWAFKAGMGFLAWGVLLIMLHAFLGGSGWFLWLEVPAVIWFAYGMFRSGKHMRRQARMESEYRSAHGIRHKNPVINWAFYDHPFLAAFAIVVLTFAVITRLML